MSKRRMKRRIVGALSKRLDELQLDDVEDERDPRGKTWSLATVLRTVMLGMAAGAKSRADVETLTDDLSSTVRRRFRISRRLPDTTARNIPCGVAPSALVPVLHRGVRQANRRKAIRHDGFPFGVACLDGKTRAPTATQYTPPRTPEPATERRLGGGPGAGTGHGRGSAATAISHCQGKGMDA